MRRREFMSAACGAAAGAFFSAHAQDPSKRTGNRPNILWITCEDISPHLGCYGDPEARTPNLDRLASEGRRYTNAFSISGVCAPSRSCLITGMYPTTLGTCHMRCDNPPPPHVRCFPEYLRSAGYYCTNNRKTDYNFKHPRETWDQCSAKAHWRARPDKVQPFFAVFNFTNTHESQVGRDLEDPDYAKRRLPPEERHDPAKAQVPPYYPATPIVRKHWAHYFDLITQMDRQAGRVLDQLEEDGLAESTVVFFYSDHGVGLPRAKRWMYDSGTHVPLLIRWPGQIEPGTVTDRLVSFVDFAPTALSIAGAPIPDHMQGVPFLGERAGKPRDYVFAARDRMDERYDIIRSARDKRFRYIRNYEPHRPYAQYLNYPEGWAVMPELRRVHQAGQLTAEQALFFRETKPLEELYDVAADPHEVYNLAADPHHHEVLERLRKVMDTWMRDTRDLGLVPEIELKDWIHPNEKAAQAPGVTYPAVSAPGAEARVFGRAVNDWIRQLNGSDPVLRTHAIKALGLAGAQAAPVLLSALADPEPAVAFWAAEALGRLDPPPEAKAQLDKLLQHSSVAVRLAAAQALCRMGAGERALPVVLAAMGDENPHARLYATQVLEAIGLATEAVHEALEQALNDDVKSVVHVAEHALAGSSR